MSDLPFSSDIPDPLAEAAARPASATVPVPRPAGESPTRSQTERRRRSAVALSLGWLMLQLCVWGIRTDVHLLSSAYLAAQVLLPSLLGASCLLVAAAPGRLGLGLGVGLLTSLGILGPLSFWILAVGMPAPHPAAAPPSFWVSSFVCLAITLAWAAAPLALAAFALGHAFVARAAWRSGLVGGGIGLLSGAAINLHCPNVDPAHLLVGHAVPVALSAVLGAFLLARSARA